MLKYLKNFSLISFSKFLFYLFFAFVPFQIDALFWTSEIYDSGFLNPYISHFLYISDVFLMLSLFFLALALAFNSRGIIFESFGKGNHKLHFFIVLFFLINFISLFVSVDVVNSAFYLLRLFEFLIVYFLLSHNFVDIKKLLYVFVGVMTFIAFIGIFQYLYQSSLGLHFIGEPIISAKIAGAAKLDLFGKTMLRAYGTFGHPNIFAGYLIFAMSFLFYFLLKSGKERRFLFALLMLVCCLAFVLTFSRGAFLALFAAAVLYYAVSNIRISLKYVFLIFALIAFFVVVFDLASVLIGRLWIGDIAGSIERNQFLGISKAMFFDNAGGVGIGNFTAVMQNYSAEKIFPWVFQPVHNMYLLILNETGLQGFIVFAGFFVYLFFALLKKLPTLDIKHQNFIHILMSIWVAIFIIGLFDHYFISLYQGKTLFWMFAGIVGASSSKV